MLEHVCMYIKQGVWPNTWNVITVFFAEILLTHMSEMSAPFGRFLLEELIVTWNAEAEFNFYNSAA